MIPQHKGLRVVFWLAFGLTVVLLGLWDGLPVIAQRAGVLGAVLLGAVVALGGRK